MDPLTLAAAQYRLGIEEGEPLRALGEELLSEGHDEAAKLAILDDLSMSEVAPVFERMCRELKRPIPPLEAAIDIVIAAILREIIDGTDQPRSRLAAPDGRRALASRAS